jgi:pimeloyl-ACP methyl ester carboxylesterase
MSSQAQFLDFTADGRPDRKIAYMVTPGRRADAPGLVWLSGFKSDMISTKASVLAEFAEEAGTPYLRFDYSGHGQSTGPIEDFTIGDWLAESLACFERFTEGPQVLIGSSMGGWIALLLARRQGAPVAGLVGIAAAPDFTEDSMWAGLDADQRRQLEQRGRVEVPSDYDDEPYAITRRLIEDGRASLVLRAPLALPFPVRLLHGSADADVPLSVALRLLEHAQCADLRLTVVAGADHRFSSPDNLEMLGATLAEILARVG